MALSPQERSRRMRLNMLMAMSYAVAGRSAFTPLSLFSAGEVGAWYDPSDFSTMFQDSAGTTPVTAVGDYVGLMLDKSRGLAIGSELVSNNTFDSDTVWSKGTGWSIGSGVATKTAGSASALSQSISVVAGTTYRLIYSATITAGSVTPRFTGGSTVSATARTASGTYVEHITAVSGNVTLEFNGNATFAGTVDNVYLKRVSGTDAFQTTSTARPQLQQDAGGRYYLSFDGTDDFFFLPNIGATGTEQFDVFVGLNRGTTTGNTGVLSLGGSGTSTSYPGMSILIRGSAAPAYSVQIQSASASANGQITTSPAFGDTGYHVLSATRTGVRLDATAITPTGSFVDFNGYSTANNRLGCLYTFSNNSYLKSSLYGFILRFAASGLSSDTIIKAETWMNTKTGSY